MKTIFDPNVREELISRIARIHAGSTAGWGKMNVFQMVRHNTYWNGWMLGVDSPVYKQVFLGKVFGGFALKRMVKDDKPFDKNIPTSEQFKPGVAGGDLETEKAEWVRLVQQYKDYHNPEFVHDFFGKMTSEQIGIMVYKHTDHHLRQFGV